MQRNFVLCSGSGKSLQGFTVAELVVTIAILGIIAAVAMPRFTARNTFDSRGFHDQATATVRYAQKIAIAQRRIVNVVVSATQVQVCYDAPCASPVTDATTGAAFAAATAPAGVSLSATSFNFDGLGKPSAAQTITFTSTIPGDPARSIVVENETGYVHPGP